MGGRRIRGLDDAGPDGYAIDTRSDLDAALQGGCGDPDCKNCGEPQEMLVLSSKCHTGAGVEAAYFKDGFVYIRCHVCQKPIVKIPVADTLLSASSIDPESN